MNSFPSSLSPRLIRSTQLVWYFIHIVHIYAHSPLDDLSLFSHLIPIKVWLLIRPTIFNIKPRCLGFLKEIVWEFDVIKKPAGHKLRQKRANGSNARIKSKNCFADHHHRLLCYIFLISNFFVCMRCRLSAHWWWYRNSTLRCAFDSESRVCVCVLFYLHIICISIWRIVCWFFFERQRRSM